MVRGRKIIEMGMGWSIISGNQARFSEDKWIMKDPLNSYESFSAWVDTCKTLFGTHIKDY